MVVYEFTVMNNEPTRMKLISESLINIIERELKKNEN